MVHLRIVVPSHQSSHALELLEETPSVCNLVFLEGVARRPDGDVILCDVAREDTSVVISDLRELEIDRDGLDRDRGHRVADLGGGGEGREGRPGHANRRGDLGGGRGRTSENIELSFSFLAFMVLAMLIATVGILTDQIVLIIGAMVVGPEFGPIAGLSVAVVQRRREVARRSLIALADRLPAGDHLRLPDDADPRRGRA